MLYNGCEQWAACQPRRHGNTRHAQEQRRPTALGMTRVSYACEYLFQTDTLWDGPVEIVND